MTGIDLQPVARAEGRTTLTEAEAKTLLASAGVPCPTFEVVDTPAAAVDAAEEIGYPVVVKVSAPEVQHKSEWGGGVGVHLGLSDSSAVESAAETIASTAQSEGVTCSMLVEEAVDGTAGVETIVSARRDQSFGPTVLFGLGGTFTEALEDVTYRLAPVSESEAESMLESIRGTALLDGFRGREAVDREAIARTITTLGDLLAAHEELHEIEVNPLLARESGVVALDALVVFESQ